MWTYLERFKSSVVNDLVDEENDIYNRYQHNKIRTMFGLFRDLLLLFATFTAWLRMNKYNNWQVITDQEGEKLER